MKKLLTLTLLIGVSQNALGMELAKLQPESRFSIADVASENLQIQLGLDKKQFSEQEVEHITESLVQSSFFKTSNNNKIALAHLVPFVRVITPIIKQKEQDLIKRELGQKAQQIEQLQQIQQNCETNHKNYKTLENNLRTAQATLKAQTLFHRYPSATAFLSFGATTAIMAVLCWNTPFETRFTALSRYFGVFAKTASAVPTGVASQS